MELSERSLTSYLGSSIEKRGRCTKNRCFRAAPKIFINTAIWKDGPGSEVLFLVYLHGMCMHLSCHNCPCNFLLNSGHNHPDFCHHSLWIFHVHIHILQVNCHTCTSIVPVPTSSRVTVTTPTGSKSPPLVPRGQLARVVYMDLTIIRDFPFKALIALEAHSGLLKVVKPKPWDTCVFQSLTLTTPETGQKLLKWSSRARPSGLKLSPPTKSFPSSGHGSKFKSWKWRRKKAKETATVKEPRDWAVMILFNSSTEGHLGWC